MIHYIAQCRYNIIRLRYNIIFQHFTERRRDVAAADCKRRRIKQVESLFRNPAYDFRCDAVDQRSFLRDDYSPGSGEGSKDQLHIKRLD